jgi:putative endonuclease
MALHNELGKNGESLAAAWLERQGYKSLLTNWQYGHLEIDIIAVKDNMPHFIEVKYKSSGRFGPPELKVTKQKFRNIANAAAAWLRRNPQFRDLRIDIVAITELPGKEPEIFLIKNVFYS